MQEYIVDERKNWNGVKYWVVVVEGYEERTFWEDLEDTEEMAHGWAEAMGYQIKGEEQ